MLAVRGLTKTFPGTVALDSVDLDVSQGEVHALLGANGAGKTTLIKILAGVYPADGGVVLFRGREARPWVSRLPISFIHQELALVPSMTVAENMALATGYPRTLRLIAWRAVRERAAEALAAVGTAIKPDTEVASLGSTERSLVAIARALAISARVIVLDEPTAALPESEVAHLFAALHRLRESGTAIVYVSHRLDEVFRLADRATVLRDGRSTGTFEISETDPEQLVERIVGRRVIAPDLPPMPQERSLVLTVDDLRAGPVGPVKLDVAAGEILGLVGLAGAGHHAIGRAIAGIVRADAGTLQLGGAPYAPGSAAAAIDAGVFFVSSDRAEEGLAMTLSVRENLYPRPVPVGESASPIHVIDRSAEREAAARAIERLGVRPPDAERTVGTLSGGNQQKVVLGRALEVTPRLLVLEEPTAGVDVGARADIYRHLSRVAGDGAGIVMISSDFEEVTQTCHRALVVDRGRIVADVPQSELSVARLTHLASGGGPARRAIGTGHELPADLTDGKATSP